MALQDDVDAMAWYHTLELPGGVVTEGLYDERSVVAKLPIPRSLAGLRCIDVAAADGFWSFEMAKRGAEFVLSADLDDTRRQDWQRLEGDEIPPPEQPRRAWRAFHIAQGALAYPQIERIDVSVYDLDPAVHGTFDFAFMGNILLHLSDPARALRSVRGVLAPGGQLLSFETISLSLSVMFRRRPVGHLFRDDAPRWWTPNRAAHLRWLEAGGFDIVESGFPVLQHMGSWRQKVPTQLPRRWEDVTYWVNRTIGLPSAWALARPKAARRRDAAEALAGDAITAG